MLREPEYLCKATHLYKAVWIQIHTVYSASIQGL